ncbi:hypothetical protein [Chroogloeocystis siderophila]|nr:hypothetical protein [Chroogloeocystis siderophila]
MPSIDRDIPSGNEAINSMEPLQKQVITLSHKVDTLYQAIEQLNGRVSEALSECRLSPTQEASYSLQNTGGRYATQGYKAAKTTMGHKDVLEDNGSIENQRQSGEKELAPEIQIQRLTAQLTAAYNRIAALEEQLLAQRIH